MSSGVIEAEEATELQERRPAALDSTSPSSPGPRTDGLPKARRAITPRLAPRQRRDSLPVIHLFRSEEVTISPHEHPDDEHVATEAGDSTDRAGLPSTAEEEVKTEDGKTVARMTTSMREPYSAFSSRQRGFICLLAACGSFWSPVTANVYFPAIPQIASDLGVSVQAINLTVTLYLIAQGISPTWWGAAGDVMGRRPVYIATLTLYVATSIGLCFTYSYGLLIALRFLQACGSACVIAIGAGTIGDIASAHERGKFYGLYSISLQSGPALGPILGGILTETLGWHAIFWVLSGASGLVVILLILFLPETLRSIVGNGSRRPPVYNRPLIPVLACKYAAKATTDEPQMSLRTRLRRIRLLDPLRLLFEKDVLCNLLFVGILYAVYTASVVSLASLLKTIYGLDSLKIGLCFIANGAGCVIASPVSGWVLTRNFRRYALHHVGADGKPATSPKDIRDLSTFPIEKARLLATWIVIPSFLVACLIYGWLIDRGVQLAGPLVMQFFIGFCFAHIMSMNSTLMVDVMPGKAASCTASNNLVRCLLGAVTTSVVEPMLNVLGAGWTFTLLTGICALSWPLIWLEWSRGMRWRAERKQRIAARAAAAA